MKSRTRKLTLRLIVAIGCAVLPLQAQAQAYPGRAVTLVVPYSAGGASDTVARIYADALRVETQQAFVIKSKPGANGLIALEYVRRAPRDGTVVLVGTPATNALPPLADVRSADLDSKMALIPVARLAMVPGVLVASPSLPVKSLTELVDYARRHPGKVSYASAGNGSLGHLNFLALESQAGIKMTHVPYKGGAQGLVDNLAGRVHLNFLNVGTALPLIGAGKLTALAVAGGVRLERLPGLASMEEQGFEGGGANWQGLFVPAGTPQETVDRLAALVASAGQKPELRSQLDAADVVFAPTESPAAFRKFVEAESRSFLFLIKKHDIRFNRGQE